MSNLKMDIQNINISSYDYKLENNRIAKYPLKERDQSKLLVYKSGEIQDAKFENVVEFIPENSLVVFNDSKVIKARIILEKATGAQIEIFCLEPIFESRDNEINFFENGEMTWKCMVGNLKRWKNEVLTKTILIKNIKYTVNVIYQKALENNDHQVVFSWLPKDVFFDEILDHIGNIPLPPYLNRALEKEDNLRYQTIYAQNKGSVAAPTAGLHFTDKVFESFSKKNIQKQYVTLHVGAGTFLPVKSETLAGHQMHDESITISKKLIQILLNGSQLHITAVGTTSMRSLESLYWLGNKISKDSEILVVKQWEPYESQNHKSFNEALNSVLEYIEFKNEEFINFRSYLLIGEGYPFKIVDSIITNFHQPQSTLLLLVDAFVKGNWKSIYNHAIENEYRFLSYGDSSILFREKK